VKRLQNDSGIALPIALGAVAVISIALVTVLSFSSFSQRSSKYSKADQTAIAVAEAGLGHAEAVLANAADPTSASALPGSGAPATISIEGGTAQYWGSLDTAADPDRWTVTSVSSVFNPSGGASLTHTVTAQFDVVVPIAGNEAWNYVYSDAPGCTYYQNTVEVWAPLYTKGDLCMKNGAALLGPKIESYGAIQREDTARIGTSASDASDPAVGTRLGCRVGSGGLSLPCADTTYNVFRSSFTNSVQSLTKPPFDATKRTTAKPGPLQGCTSSSGPVPSFTTTGAIDLMPGASYTCQVWSSPPSGGTLLGELSWDNDPGDKLLTVKGTIWFDGELMLNNTQDGSYNGEATIYFAKRITLQNSGRLCAIPGCPTTGWDPNVELLTLASGDSGVLEIKDSAHFQGAVYATGIFKLQNFAIMHGPVIAGQVEVSNNGFPASWPPLTSLPDGTPSNTGLRPVLVAGSWRG
jgi:Tfp pilus assembly protein PilX